MGYLPHRRPRETPLSPHTLWCLYREGTSGRPLLVWLLGKGFHPVKSLEDLRAAKCFPSEAAAKEVRRHLHSDPASGGPVQIAKRAWLRKRIGGQV